MYTNFKEFRRALRTFAEFDIFKIVFFSNKFPTCSSNLIFLLDVDELWRCFLALSSFANFEEFRGMWNVKSCSEALDPKDAKCGIVALNLELGFLRNANCVLNLGWRSPRKGEMRDLYQWQRVFQIVLNGPYRVHFQSGCSSYMDRADLIIYVARVPS